jgi:hypothetical protein
MFICCSITRMISTCTVTNFSRLFCFPFFSEENFLSSFRRSFHLYRCLQVTGNTQKKLKQIFTRQQFLPFSSARFVIISPKARQMHRRCCSRPRARHLPAMAWFGCVPGNSVTFEVQRVWCTWRFCGKLLIAVVVLR